MKNVLVFFTFLLNSFEFKKILLNLIQSVHLLTILLGATAQLRVNANI